MENDDLLKLKEGNFLSRRKFEKILKEENSAQLAIRADSARKQLENMKAEPFESIEEFVQRKRPIQEMLRKIFQTIREKDKQAKLSKFEAQKQWVINEIPNHFHHTQLFRYVSGEDAHMLRQGLSRPDQIKWKPVTTAEIEIKTHSGRTLKFNLLEKISPAHWKHMLANPLTPMIYNTERGVIGLKDGKKPTGIWHHPQDYKKASRIKPVRKQTYIAIMCV